MTKSILFVYINLLNVFWRPEMLTRLEICEAFLLDCVPSLTHTHTHIIRISVGSSIDMGWLLVYIFLFYKHDAGTSYYEFLALDVNIP